MKTKDPKSTLPNQQKHYDAFLAAVKGIDAHKVARALGMQTPGIVWTGCSKTHMATQYAREMAPMVKTVVVYPGLNKINLALLAIQAKGLRK